MKSNNYIDERLIDTLIFKQACRERLFGGDSLNPRTERINKKIVKLKESHSSDNSVDYKALCPEFNSTPKSQSSTAQYAIAISPSVNGFIDKRVESDKKKKKKKHNKQRKHQIEQIQMVLSDNLLEVDCKSSNIMAELMKASNCMIISNHELYLYKSDKGCFEQTSRRDIARDLRSLLDEESKLKISSRQYLESYEQLLISEELECADGFFANKPYVNCLNGVVDVLNGKLLEHSHKYKFKHCINANYVPGEGKCTQFLNYLDHITQGDDELKKLLRVSIGYLCSHYNNAKKALLLYAIPHTGKSVLCSLIERIIGSDYTCHIDLAFLHRQEYAASLSSTLLNVAPDLKNEALKDVGFFKSLISHDDTISARKLYDNPKDIRCETKMLFSSNHLLTFDASLGQNDIEAVFNRLIFIPFQNQPITDLEDNKHLSDDLYEERDLIFTWAIKGLKDYIENNETFPKAKLSEDLKRLNMSRYCPEKTFFEECIKVSEGCYESSAAIKDAFSKYCLEHGVTQKTDLVGFLELHQRIPKAKKRIDNDGKQIGTGNPIYVYEGIRLKKKYRQ